MTWTREGLVLMLHVAWLEYSTVKSCSLDTAGRSDYYGRVWGLWTRLDISSPKLNLGTLPKKS